MTLREKFKGLKISQKNTTATLNIDLDTAIELEQIADDYAIEILERYHNSLFIIPLKEGEAKEILKHLKNETNTLTKN